MRDKYKLLNLLTSIAMEVLRRAISLEGRVQRGKKELRSRLRRRQFQSLIQSDGRRRKLNKGQS
jgi:hypothetical protein